ncbi:hypothetical protein BMR1_02g03010 [Babesia microti strain RI]|uniref:AMP-dependent synthetase/ligase domain-containing protein n=1 Tax=Babesia microti (strain RI) TaxID=1133968 RepID=A0A1R4AAP0_BABMR|nr:hypothetical protein BMR1_02g03010 [Babesia microti strain RI]SJK86068.1 hypothetical protein BMR1_02g03010 [Babesia microti strain RI]|eukprot:XP_021338264.1 hypothetical protein BMR1_02g03010 [Babesia microti strain RI]
MEIVSFRNLHKNYCSFYRNTSRYRIEKINVSRLSVLFAASVFTRKIMRILRRSSLIGTVICVNFKHTRLENLYILTGCLLSGATLLNTNWHTDTKKSIEYKLRMTGCEIVIQDDTMAFEDRNMNRLDGVLYISLYEIFTPAVEEKCNSLATYLSPFDAVERAKSDSNIQRMLNHQMKESNNIPPDTIHLVAFSSGSDSDHPKASKIQYQHLYSCYDRLETMGRWDQKEPLIILVANPIYEPFTSIILSYSLYRPNTTLHLLQRYNATYWKIIWEMNEYYKHVYNDCSYKIFTSLYPRQLEALLTLEQVAKECSIFDPIIDYKHLVPIPPQGITETVIEYNGDDEQMIDEYSRLMDRNTGQWEGLGDSSDMKGSNSAAEMIDPAPKETCTDPCALFDTKCSEGHKSLFTGSSGAEDLPPKHLDPSPASGSGEFEDFLTGGGRMKGIHNPLQANFTPGYSRYGAVKTMFRLNKFDFKAASKPFGQDPPGEWLLKSKIKQSLLDQSSKLKSVTWPIYNKLKLHADKIGKSESTPRTEYSRSKLQVPLYEKRTESLVNIPHSRKSSTYIPKLRMKFSELRSVLADKNVLFSLGGAPIYPETCYTFSNVCKGKISILYYGSTETAFPLIHSASGVRERDDLLNIMKRGWTHEYQGLPCRGHYVGRPFEQSDNVKVVKSVNKNNANFMIECDAGEPGYIICKANINCQLCEPRIHEDHYLGLDDVGFYLYSAEGEDSETAVKEFFWMHKVDLSLCENYPWKFRLAQTSRLIHEFICDMYDIPQNKVYVKTFGLMHGDTCIYCCAVELVQIYTGTDNEPEPTNLDVEELSKDISENLLDRCRKSEIFKGLVLPDVLRVGSIPFTYKGTPDMKLLKETFKALI